MFDWMLALNIMVYLRFYIKMIDQISTGPFTFTALHQSDNHEKQRASRWAKKDLLKYAVFLHYVFTNQIFPSFAGCGWSVFRSLSLFLQNKNPNQCRILHLDMLQTYGSIEAILHSFFLKNQDFLSLCQKFESTITNIVHIIFKEKSKKVQSTSLAYTRPTIDVIQHVHDPKDEKSKQQLKPTDIYYPEQPEQAFQINTEPITSQKRLGISEKTSNINNEKRQEKQSYMEFVEYRRRVIKIGGGERETC